MEDQKLRKGKRWLGGNFKSCIFVPPTPGSELVKLMQQKEKDMRPGGRENYAIKIIESAGNPIERMLVNVDPFNGNKCEDKKCVLSKNSSNKIKCRKNNVGYQMECKICLKAGMSSPATYFGETGRNGHTRMKEHVSKFNSKKDDVKKDSAFIKHLMNKHKEVDINTVNFEDVYDVKVIRAYRKVFTRGVDEGTNIGAHDGELLNSKSEWRQPSIIRNVIVSGGAEVLAGVQGGSFPRAGSSRSAEGGVASGEMVRDGEDGVASRTRSRRPIG